MTPVATPELLSTGIHGLDTILGGGLTPHRIYLVEGEPGTGKTTTGLQFLSEGLRRGERVVYITLAETATELAAVAQSHGMDPAGLHIHEVLPTEDLLAAEQQYTTFHPSEVEMASSLRPNSCAVTPALSNLSLLVRQPAKGQAARPSRAVRRCTRPDAAGAAWLPAVHVPLFAIPSAPSFEAGGC